MRFTETELRGAFIIDPEPVLDGRGFFSRAFCRNEFESRKLDPNVVQCNISFNAVRGTLRGMHYQAAPRHEVKLVRCTMGSVFDVIIDLRRDSSSFLKWTGIELNADNHRMLYVPRTFAHGYVTLCDNAEVFYQVSEFYSKESERGVRWDDPAFKISWPIVPCVISDKDRCHPDFVL